MVEQEKECAVEREYEQDDNLEQERLESADQECGVPGRTKCGYEAPFGSGGTFHDFSCMLLWILTQNYLYTHFSSII